MRNICFRNANVNTGFLTKTAFLRHRDKNHLRYLQDFFVFGRKPLQQTSADNIKLRCLNFKQLPLLTTPHAINHPHPGGKVRNCQFYNCVKFYIIIITSNWEDCQLGKKYINYYLKKKSCMYQNFKPCLLNLPVNVLTTIRYIYNESYYISPI